MFKVLKDFRGSPDGFTVIEYLSGAKVDLVPALAEVAIKEKWVKELPPEPKVAAEATPAAVTPAPTPDAPSADVSIPE